VDLPPDCPTDEIQPFPISLHFDHLCALNNESVRQRYRCRNLYRPLRPNGIGLPIFHNPPCHQLLFTYRKIVKDLFTCQEAKRDFSLAWFAESHDNVVENLYHQKTTLPATRQRTHILNLLSNHRSPSGASSKNSKPQHEANASLRRIERRTTRRRKGLPPLPIRVVRSVTDVVSTHQVLRLVIYRHSVKSLKHGEIEMVPNWWLPSRKLLTL
jgi:hypothetical protein